MFGYIYITTNKINGKIYIGQHKGAYNENYFGSGKYICMAVEKYGKENFENHIIEWCETPEKMDEREIYWIKKYDCTAKSKTGYNIAEGGQGNILKYATDEHLISFKKNVSNGIKEWHKNMTNERKAEISLSLKRAAKTRKRRIYACKEKHHLYGKRRSKEERVNISIGNKNAYKKNPQLLEDLKKKVTVIYKGIEYNFDSRTECEKWFLENMNLNVYYWMRGKIFEKYKNDVKYVKVGDKIKVDNRGV